MPFRFEFGSASRDLDRELDGHAIWIGVARARRFADAVERVGHKSVDQRPNEELVEVDDVGNSFEERFVATFPDERVRDDHRGCETSWAPGSASRLPRDG